MAVAAPVEDDLSAGMVVDDDDAVCRVCHGPAEPGNELYHPCNCSGSIKFVHQECLLEWLKVSKQGRTKGRCELCGEPFLFTPLYRRDAPTQLPYREFARGVAARARALAPPVLLSLIHI